MWHKSSPWRPLTAHTTHTGTHTDTNKHKPMALKGILQSFWLEHFNRVFYCTHILCRLCSKFSSTWATHSHTHTHTHTHTVGLCMCWCLARKVEISLEQNVSESSSSSVCVSVCVLRLGVVFSATFAGVREKPHCGTLCASKFRAWSNTLKAVGQKKKKKAQK